MAEPALSHRMTVAEFYDWHDGTDIRYELVRGVPVGPRPARRARRMNWRLALAAVLLATGAQAQDTELIERGHALVERNCASCHAIGSEDASPLPEAPAFRDLKKKYSIEDLAEPLAEGIETGHPQMPTRAFAPEEVDAILAYLGTL